jgi:creatinine amidohydrolase
MMRPWILAETNYSDVKQSDFEVAVLPMGATEPHNLHLPYGTDTFEVDALGQQACEAAWNRGAKVVLLPTIPYGTETNMARCPLAMNVNPSTLGLVIRDLVTSLAGHGISKLLILNGHGGNDFKPVVRELTSQTTVSLFLCDWFRGLSIDVQCELFDDPGDHAGATESALGLAYFDHLVRKNADGSLAADDGAVRESRLDAVNEGWVSISRPWHLLTTNTGCGNPHQATAEKGKRLMEVMVDRLSGFLVDLAAAEIDGQFPF